jgi:argininosuccinate lyase
MSERLIRFNTSLPIEARLFEADIRASMAHTSMLHSCGLLNAEEHGLLSSAFESIQVDYGQGRIELRPDLEDIHMNLEVLLIERAGEVGKKVHTARSRNDQQAVAQRLFFRESTADLCAAIRRLQRAILDHCRAQPDLIMPSYTHLQRAEFTTYAHWLTTYVVMLQRDRTRFEDALRRADECPLGACASTGSSLGIDRRMTARALGFARATAHSIDSVSDRDYLVEFANTAALLMVHLSRLSEELVVFTSQEFGLIELADAYCTGSSIMPQKKNPDVLELVRGKSATVIGGAVSLLTLMKALPLGYNKDTQEDKTSWFAALDASQACLEILTDVIATMRPVPARMLAATQSGHVLATEYANHLVGRGIAFREAHRIVGELVKIAEERGVDLTALDLDTLRAVSPAFGEQVVALRVESLVGQKSSLGACAPDPMRELFSELDDLVDTESR